MGMALVVFAWLAGSSISLGGAACEWLECSAAVAASLLAWWFCFCSSFSVILRVLHAAKAVRVCAKAVGKHTVLWAVGKHTVTVSNSALLCAALATQPADNTAV
jgi:hypothetical protein